MTRENVIVMRASPSSYMALCGIWVVMAIFYTYLGIRRPGTNVWVGAAISGCVATGFAMWVRGFRISIADGWLEYRDGFFRSTRVPLHEVVETRVEWVQINYHGLGRKIPRIVVVARNGALLFRINPKPFKLADLRRIPGMESERFGSRRLRE